MKKPISLLFLFSCLFLAHPSIYAQIGVFRAPTTAAPNLANSPFANWGTYVGDSAGFNMNFGFHSTLMGHGAGFSLVSDGDNTLIGSFANYLGTKGIDNVIIGARAGYRNIASDVVMVGNMAGHNHTTGNDVVFIGEDAGYYNTTGTDNVFVGEDAGYNNISGGDNTFIGNTAGRQNTTGYRNTAIGNEALFDLGGNNNTDAHHNTAVGDSSGTDNGEGIWNTYVGAASGAANEFGICNTFLGGRAGFDNNRTNARSGAGSFNTFVGFKTGESNREGRDNVGMGARANTLGFTTTSQIRNRTTFIGSRALVYADDVVAIGYEVDARKQYGIAIGTEANSDGLNAIAIGYQTSVTADNEVRIGNSAMANIGGVVNWTATSDGRMKSALKENVPGLDFITQLRPLTYQMDMEKEYELRGEEVPEGLVEGIHTKKGIRYSGFVAQEVEEVAKSVGYDFSGVKVPDDPDEELYGLRYAEFVVPLVKAVQELNEKIEKQDQILAHQAAQIQEYQRLMAQQKELSPEEKIKAYEEQLGQYAKMFEVMNARLHQLEAQQNKQFLVSTEDD
ncbi:MAG: tail fiber domain-containing protein [Bacteroidota bacterium]